MSIIDSKDTIQRLKNFNDNMKHIRISGEIWVMEQKMLYMRVEQ